MSAANLPAADATRGFQEVHQEGEDDHAPASTFVGLFDGCIHSFAFQEAYCVEDVLSGADEDLHVESSEGLYLSVKDARCDDASEANRFSNHDFETFSAASLEYGEVFEEHISRSVAMEQMKLLGVDSVVEGEGLWARSSANKSNSIAGYDEIVKELDLDACKHLDLSHELLTSQSSRSSVTACSCEVIDEIGQNACNHSDLLQDLWTSQSNRSSVTAEICEVEEETDLDAYKHSDLLQGLWTNQSNRTSVSVGSCQMIDEISQDACNHSDLLQGLWTNQSNRSSVTVENCKVEEETDLDAYKHSDLLQGLWTNQSNRTSVSAGSCRMIEEISQDACNLSDLLQGLWTNQSNRSSVSAENCEVVEETDFEACKHSDLLQGLCTSHSTGSSVTAGGCEVIEETDLDACVHPDVLHRCIDSILDNTQVGTMCSSDLQSCASGFSTFASYDGDPYQEGNAYRYAKEQIDALLESTEASLSGWHKTAASSVVSTCSVDTDKIEPAVLASSIYAEIISSTSQCIPISQGSTKADAHEGLGDTLSSLSDFKKPAEVKVLALDSFKKALKLGDVPDRSWISNQTRVTQSSQRTGESKSEISGKEAERDAATCHARVDDVEMAKEQSKALSIKRRVGERLISALRSGELAAAIADAKDITSCSEQLHKVELKVAREDPCKLAVRMGSLPKRAWSSQDHGHFAYESRCQKLDLEGWTSYLKSDARSSTCSGRAQSLKTEECGQQVETRITAIGLDASSGPDENARRAQSKDTCLDSDPYRFAVRLGCMPDKRLSLESQRRYRAVGSPLNACRAELPCQRPKSADVRRRYIQMQMQEPMQATLARRVPFGVDTGTYINALLEARFDSAFQKDHRGAGIHIAVPNPPSELRLERTFDKTPFTNYASIDTSFAKAQAELSKTSAKPFCPQPPATKRLRADLLRPRRPMSAR